jgi:hypothetical protein
VCLEQVVQAVTTVRYRNKPNELLTAKTNVEIPVLLVIFKQQKYEMTHQNGSIIQ